MLIPACASSCLAFHMMYTAYKLNKLDDNIQPWCTCFPVWNYFFLLCPVLTVASWPMWRFLRRQIRWSGIHISWGIFHSLLWSIHSKALVVVNEAEVDAFLELSCFFCDPADVGNLISGSSAFSGSSLNIWKFSVHILLKPSLKDFEHYLPSMWNECNCMVFWTFFAVSLLWDWNENWPLPVLWSLMSFPNLLVYWMQHFHSIIFYDLK